MLNTETKERSPSLEAALRRLPILAKPALTVSAERETENAGDEAELAFRDQLHFEVRRDLHNDENEYCVVPLKTRHVTGVMSYEPSAPSVTKLRVLSVWPDLLEVEFQFKGERYVFDLCFSSRQKDQIN